MICTNCVESKPIPSCAESLVVGSVTTEESSVFVFIKNNATGYVATQEVVPDDNDLISISLSDPYPDFYSPNFFFTITVSESEDGNDQIPFTIDSVEHDCITALFQKVYSEDEIVMIDTVTLKV